MIFLTTMKISGEIKIKKKQQQFFNNENIETKNDKSGRYSIKTPA